MSLNYGINGDISVAAARAITVASSTPIAIVATTDSGPQGMNFYGSAETAITAYAGATEGTLLDALKDIDAQATTCPIIVYAIDSVTADAAAMIAGVDALKNAYSVTGYRPDLIVCPEWSGTLTVATAMDAMATRLWATAIVDVTAANETEALAFKANFGTRFVLLVGPEEVTINGRSVAGSAGWAGLIAYYDGASAFGWAESHSNRVMKGVSSTTRLIDYADGQDCEARRLRQAGIASVVRDEGWRTYGFETTDIDPIWQPLNRVRTFYKMLRAMMQAAKWARDRQADELLYVKKSIEEFMRGLKGAGVALGFEVFFDTEKNTKATVTNGQFFLTVRFQDMPTIRELNIELVYVDDYSDVLLTIING
ncbi:MAG: phage tail sheath family protein [Campylobacterota bacterium]